MKTKKIRFPSIRKEMTTKEKILYLIKTKKATRLTDIAVILKKRKSTISQHLDEMTKAKAVWFKTSGKSKLFRAGKKPKKKRAVKRKRR